MLAHLREHHALYGEYTGVRSARKHLGWYARSLPLSESRFKAFRERINALTTAEAQLDAVAQHFDAWASTGAPGTAEQKEWKLAA